MEDFDRQNTIVINVNPDSETDEIHVIVPICLWGLKDKLAGAIAEAVRMSIIQVPHHQIWMKEP